MVYSRSPNAYNFPQYYYNSGSPTTRYESRLQDCSCPYPETIMDKPLIRKTSTSSSSIPIQAKSHRYDDKYPVMTDLQNQLYEEIYPTNKERINGSPNPPDIANVSSYSQLENHNAYDPEFIRKQPDILQSAYYGNRSASSLSTDPAAGACYSNYSPQLRDSSCIDELKRKSLSLPKSFQRNDKMRTEFRMQDK